VSKESGLLPTAVVKNIDEFESGKTAVELRRVLSGDTLAEWGRKIIQLHVSGLTGQQITNELDISKSTVSKVIRSKAGKEEAKRLRKHGETWATQNSERVQELVDLSLSLYRRVLQGRDEDGNQINISLRDKLRVADIVTLELSDLKHQAQAQAQSRLSGDVLKDIRNLGVELMKTMGFNKPTIIDAEIVTDGESRQSIN